MGEPAKQSPPKAEGVAKTRDKFPLALVTKRVFQFDVVLQYKRSQAFDQTIYAHSRILY